MAGMRYVFSAIALGVALLCLAELALQVLIGYQIHRSGHFHGIPWRMGDVVRAASISGTLLIFCVWAGVRLIRPRSG